MSLRKVASLASLMAAAMALNACTAKIEAPAPDTTPPPSNNGQLANTPVAGKVQNLDWQLSSAIAEITETGDLQVILAGHGEVLRCGNTWFRRAAIAFVVPHKTGVYRYSSNTGGQAVTFMYPPEVTNTGGYENVIADTSTLAIDSLAGGRVAGRVSAQTLNARYPASINGQFEAILCN